MLELMGFLFLILIAWSAFRVLLKKFKQKRMDKICTYAYEAGIPLEFSVMAAQNLGPLDKVLKQLEENDPDIIKMPISAQYATAIAVLYKEAEKTGLFDKKEFAFYKGEPVKKVKTPEELLKQLESIGDEDDFLYK